uniref:cyclin-D5-1-like isoform X2 n=1 Tax=Erigeron canadensis TaxID=72917 RepID=UPI001CB90C19|nr:cyclin-D5-1-like isoform X2 [Erigeron canadensis]
MAGSSSFSLSRFLSHETETESGLQAEDEDENDESDNEYVSMIPDEECVRVLLDKERVDHTHIYSNVEDWIKVARSQAIQWIINARSFLQLSVRTAYLSITYIDRFLSKGLVIKDKHWAVRLLSVACLSLATKMEERMRRPLSAFVTGEDDDFEITSIHRMELLVLNSMDWKMHSVTPFHFIHYFISYLCESSLKKHFVSLTRQIIFAATKDMNILEHRASTIAMAATLMVMDQNLTKESLEIKMKTTWLNQLYDHEDVYTCYTRLLKLEPLKVDLAKNIENSLTGTKRKRLTFSEEENMPNEW